MWMVGGVKGWYCCWRGCVGRLWFEDGEEALSLEDD